MSSTPLVTNPVPIFFIVLVIILLAPLLLNKLKIPHIIGMIVAGVVIGPYGLNVLARDSSFEIFGQVGILYLMFLAGLEIDMYHLKLNLRRGTVFGILTLLIPLLMGVFTSVYILHVDWLTAMLLGAMYASHTLISYPVVTRYGITKTPPVLIAIVGTLIAVIGALLVLAVTTNIKREGAFNAIELLRFIASVAVYVLVVLYSFPRITRRFFKRYSDKVTQYVFVLAMVFLSAWAAQLINLEPVLGAFFAGIVLNRFIPSASPLMYSIEFVGNALFIPYFLIGVGMMINMRVLTNPDTLIMACVMLAIAIASKWLPALLTQKLYHFDAPGRNILFGLTAAHTAVALAVVALGYNMAMFDEKILNGTVLVILISCAIAPIITARAAAREKIKMVAEEQADHSDDDSSSAMSRFDRPATRTAVAVSNPLTIQSLVELAVLMTDASSAGAVPTAVHVRNDNSPKDKALSRNALQQAREAASAANVMIDTIERYDLNTVTGLANIIAERDINQIIIGQHRRATVIDSALGVKTEQLLNATNRMVVIARSYIPAGTVTRIVVTVPAKAQYETGFTRWVCAVANLTAQIGCRVIFCCSMATRMAIEAVLNHNGYGIRSEFRPMESSDDFLLLSRRVLPDDLFVFVGARVNSLSYTADIADMPEFIDKHFTSNNLLLIYPEQFGTEAVPISFTDPRAADITATPATLLRRIKRFLGK